MDVTRNEGVLMSTAQHVWACDGNVQSCHWVLTNLVDGGNVQVFLLLSLML